jgi:hypothetical protein
MRVLPRTAARLAIAVAVMKTPSVSNVGTDAHPNETACECADWAGDDRACDRAQSAVTQPLLRSGDARCNDDSHNNHRNANECAHNKRSS